MIDSKFSPLLLNVSRDWEAGREKLLRRKRRISNGVIGVLGLLSAWPPSRFTLHTNHAVFKSEDYAGRIYCQGYESFGCTSTVETQKLRQAVSENRAIWPINHCDFSKGVDYCGTATREI
jgi:hypothetical protein